MNKKLIVGCTLVLTISFLLLGVVFKGTAKIHQGISASSGVMIDGKYYESTTGRIGANSEKYEMFNNGGTIFYVLAGVTGVICVISAVAGNKSN